MIELADCISDVEMKGDLKQCRVLKRDIVPQTHPLAGIPPMLAEHPGLYRELLGDILTHLHISAHLRDFGLEAPKVTNNSAAHSTYHKFLWGQIYATEHSLDFCYCLSYPSAIMNPFLCLPT